MNITKKNAKRDPMDEGGGRFWKIPSPIKSEAIGLICIFLNKKL